MKNTLAISSIVGGKSSGGSGTGGAVDSVNGKTGTVVLTGNDLSVSNTNTTKVAAALTENGNAIVGLSADLNDLSQVVEGKQDKLTAGKNVSIVNNVISAGGFTNETLVGGKDIEIVPLEPVGGIDSNTSLLLHFDRNFADSSLNKIAYTTSGTGNYTESHTGFGEAVCISGGTVEYAHDTAFNFGTGDWSIDFWAMITSTSDAGGYLLFTNNGATVFNAKIENGVMSFFLTTDPAPTFTYNIETVGVFNHFAFERKDGTVYWFLNGIQQGSVAHADAMANVTAFAMHNSGNNSVYFDELRIEKGYAPFETTGFEVNKYPYTESADNAGIHVVNYTGKEVPEDIYTQSNLLAGKGIEIIDEPVEGGIDEHTVGCWHFDGNKKNAVDGSAMTMGTVVGYVEGKFGSACRHPTQNAAGFTPTGDFSYDFWIKATGALNTRVGGNTSSATGRCARFYILSSQKVASYISTDASVSTNPSADMPLNTWTHLAYCKKDGMGYWFVNGKLIDKRADTTTTTSYWSLVSENPDYYQVDEYRISDIARWTEDFTPPTKPYRVAIPTGNKVINSTVISGVTTVNTKTGDVTLTADDINVTYTHDGAETTTSIKAFADIIDQDIENLNELMPGIATTTVAGTVKPDGTSIAINETGTISTINTVHSTAITTIVKLTQAEYDALTTKDENTLYYIV